MLYPRHCALCDELLPGTASSVCAPCRGRLAWIGENYCMKCGKPVLEEQEYCDDCAGKETAFLAGRAAFVYDGWMQKSMARFKYGQRQEYASFFAGELYKKQGRWMREIGAEALIPVPIHRERRRVRGYNQAECIAKELGGLSGLPVFCDWLVRTQNTLPQKKLTARERQKNLSDAFALSSFFEKLYKNQKCVIIIDDIYTTGSTVQACAQVLQAGGIEKIYFLCVCTGRGC